MARKKPKPDVSGYFKKNLPPEIMEYFREQGARGGKAAAGSMTPEQRAARAKKAADAATRARKAASKETGRKPEA